VIPMQSLADAFSGVATEIVAGIGVVTGFLIKEVYEARRERSLIKSELSMGEEKTRLERHEEEMDDMREAVSDFQSSIREMDRHFTGDEDDPSKRGLLNDVHEIRQDMKQVKRSLRRSDDIDIEAFTRGGTPDEEEEER